MDVDLVYTTGGR